MSSSGIKFSESSQKPKTSRVISCRIEANQRDRRGVYRHHQRPCQAPGDHGGVVSPPGPLEEGKRRPTVSGCGAGAFYFSGGGVALVMYLATMQEINRQYEAAFNRLKNGAAADGEKQTSETAGEFALFTFPAGAWRW